MSVNANKMAPIQETPSDRFAVLAMNTLAALILLIAVTASAAAATEAGPPVRMEEVGEGTLLLRGRGAGAYRAALVQKSDVEIDVTGLIARAVVRQEFANSSKDWMEGIYVFPLPHGAAVDGLRLMVGERVIEGRIEERQKAQKNYAQAKRQGKKAALVEAERPNIFTAAVANIAPGENVRVEIRYQQTLAYQSGEFRLRFPMVVGPRHAPGAAQIARFGAHGWAASASGRIKEETTSGGERISQPVRRPGINGARGLNPVTLTVRLNAGFPLAGVQSHHHRIQIKDQSARGEGRRIITLAQGSVPADRDFELTWRPKPGAAPRAGLFIETEAPSRSGPHIRHALLMLLPPPATALEGVRPPRELLFVLDTSGSMGGQSILQAKAALSRALDSLRPGDRFNIIEFNNRYSMLFASSVAASPNHLGQAKAWLSRLQAGGGTEMAPALAAALAQARVAGYLRQVVFLTDGAVSNEAELFALIADKLGSARLFTMGIGSAPNGHFMRGAAQAGRGSFVHIGAIAQVGARVDELVRKLSHPVLTDIQVRFDDVGTAELARDPVPDLYAGEPLLVAAKLTGRTGTVWVTGRRGKDVWSQSFEMQGGQLGVGIARLWAQRRITALEDNPKRSEDSTALDARVLSLALDYGLVSRLTALIAVDETIARAGEDPLLSQDMAANLPHGWDYDKVFGKSATGAKHKRQAANMLRGAAPTVSLPATATPASLLTAAGLILILLALALLAMTRPGWRRAAP